MSYYKLNKGVVLIMNLNKEDIQEIDLLLNILKWQFFDNIEFEKQNCMDTSYSKTMYNKCLKYIRKINAITKEE